MPFCHRLHIIKETNGEELKTILNRLEFHFDIDPIYLCELMVCSFVN